MKRILKIFWHWFLTGEILEDSISLNNNYKKSKELSKYILAFFIKLLGLQSISVPDVRKTTITLENKTEKDVYLHFRHFVNRHDSKYPVLFYPDENLLIISQKFIQRNTQGSDKSDTLIKIKFKPIENNRTQLDIYYSRTFSGKLSGIVIRLFYTIGYIWFVGYFAINSTPEMILEISIISLAFFIILIGLSHLIRSMYEEKSPYAYSNIYEYALEIIGDIDTK